MDLAYLTYVQTRNRIHSVFHCIYELVRSGCACRDPKRISIEEPFCHDIIRPLHMMHAPTKSGTSTGQFTSVVAVRTSNNQYHIRLFRQFLCCQLPLLGGLTHGVHKTDLSNWESELYLVHKYPHTSDRLCGLGHYAVTGIFGKGINIRFVQNHIIVSQIFR